MGVLKSLCIYYSVLVCGLVHRMETKQLSYIRAASQVWVVNGVSEVEAQLNALCSERAEDIFADGTGKHRESI